MIPVVQEHIQKRNCRVENTAADTVLAEAPGKPHIHIAHASDVVVHQPDFHSLVGFAYQNLPDFLEGGVVRYDEILHEYELFRLLQIGLHGLQGLGAVAEVFRGGVFVDGPVFMDGKVAELVGIRRAPLLQALHGVRVLRQILLQLLPDSADALTRFPRVSGDIKKQKQAQAHDRQGQNQHNPGHFHGRGGVLAGQAEHHDYAQNGGKQIDPRGVCVQLHHQYNQPGNLKKDGETDKAEP